MAGLRLTDEIIAKINLPEHSGLNNSEIATLLGITRGTVLKYRKVKTDSEKTSQAPQNNYARLPTPDTIAGGPELPTPIEIECKPYEARDRGFWGVISDIHIPFHDLPTLKAFVKECKRTAVVGIHLNGDILDFHGLSDHFKEPNGPKIGEEIKKGRQLLEYLRGEFPKARIIYKEGNHDFRLKRYIANRAPELFDLTEVQLPSLLGMGNLGIEWVDDKRIVNIGNLPTLHGHEYQGGGGVMPARWLFLRTAESAMMGHFHHPTAYTFRSLTGKEIGLWSTGCACSLQPQYRPYNQWAHAFAMVDVQNDSHFVVHQRRVLKDGTVV